MKKFMVEAVTDNKEWFDGEKPSCGISMSVSNDITDADTAQEAIELVIDWAISETANNGGKAEIVNEDLKILMLQNDEDVPNYLHNWTAKEIEE